MPPTSERPVVGWREWVALPDCDGAWLAAKVDTGARTSAVHAEDVELDAAGGTARFTLFPNRAGAAPVVVQATLVGERDVRSSNGAVERRPVVTTPVVVAGLLIVVELSLTRRNELGFEMLLGRTALRRRFLVDPGRSFRGGGDRHQPPG